MEALTRWLRALIFTPGDSPATGAQEGNRTPDLRITSALNWYTQEQQGSDFHKKQLGGVCRNLGFQDEAAGNVQ